MIMIVLVLLSPQSLWFEGPGLRGIRQGIHCIESYNLAQGAARGLFNSTVRAQAAWLKS